MKLLLTTITLILFSSCTIQVGRTFYVDPAGGSDRNSGSSPGRAWATLEKVNGQEFEPGDKILFKSGAVFTGQLELKSSGSKGYPVIASSYGGNKKPLIQGNGVKQYAVLIKNAGYIKISKLEITNTGKEREAGRTGVLIEAKDYGEMHDIVLDSLEIHDVNGSLVKEIGGGSAILWLNGGDSIPSRFIGLTIENCYLHDCGRNGIISNGYAGRDHWYPSLDVAIRGNLLERIPGDGIVPIGCDSALIEYNIMRDCPDTLSYEEAAAGIWPWSCDNTIIQYNEVSGHKARWDGQGFDSDYNCSGTIIRYNYSHDNYGGFLLVCNDGNSLGKNWNHGTKNSLIEFNLSVNDGIRPYPTKQAGWFSPVFHITGPVENTTISNNVVLSPSKNSPAIPSEMIHMGDWGSAWPQNTTIERNHFFAAADSTFSWGKAQNTSFEKNEEQPIGQISDKTVLSILDSLAQYSPDGDRQRYEKLEKFVLNKLN